MCEKMKKRLYISCLLFFLGFHINPVFAQYTAGSPNEELFLDWEDAKNRRGQYSALTDVHHVSVFSEEFTELIKQYQNREQKEKENLFFTIINREQKEQTFDEAFYSVLNAESERIKQKELNEEMISSKKDNIMIIMGFLLVMLISFYIMMEVRRKTADKEKEHEDNFDSYYIGY